jgi:pyruvate dehydrogenase E2 component (dihydrolipoamide acetyltransferase)
MLEEKVRATPSARRIARTLGVNLRDVKGSGPHGRIQGEDVRQSVAGEPLAISAQISETVPPSFPSREPKIVPFTNVRRIIADRLQRSAQEAPHIYFEANIDAGALEELRARANSRQADAQPRISLTALLVRVVGWALERHPFINSRLDGENILLLPDIHIGVAVAADTGLIVPVVRNANQKSVRRITAELQDLTSRAHQNRLLLEDVTGGTFTISNLGMFGVERFTAIINPPQSAILAVGRVRKVFVPDENDRPVVRSIMTITLGVDHRVIDGAIAARFLADLRDCMEHPDVMIL